MIVDMTFHKAPPQQYQRVRTFRQNLHSIVLTFDDHEHIIPVKDTKSIQVSND